MATVTQPLRDEHKELLPSIARLQVVADEVGEAPLAALRRDVDEVYDFLNLHLLPHAQAEDAALYPVVGRLLGCTEATATMSRDHVEIQWLAQELGQLRAQLAGASTLDPALAKALRRVLYGLSALVKLHFTKEEELYLTLLDKRLQPDEARAMFARMEEAAHAAKARAAAPAH